ncbi:MAG: IS110 family transposase [Chloroflexi bacterium]|nr:MAG: IS110 family transposase [Chloroflexota bacterium]
MASPFATPDTLVIALDIGKNVHWIGCYDGLLNVLVKPYEVRSNLPGFHRLTATVDPLLQSGRFRQAVIGHEATGVYHEPWMWQIFDHYASALAGLTPCPLTYRLLNPRLTKQWREQRSLRPQSTDPRAVLAVAGCLAEGLGHPLVRPTAQQVALLEGVRAYHHLEGHRRLLAHQLYPQIDRLWPGAIVDLKRFRKAHPHLEPPSPIVCSQALDRQRMAALLLHLPNPHDALALGEEGLLALLRREVGRAGPQTVAKVLRVLREAPLPPKDMAPIYARRLQEDYQRYLEMGKRLEGLRAEIEALAFQTDARFLVSIPGVSPLLAARYYAIVAPIQRFRRAAQVWAYAGFDPISDSSGDGHRVGEVSKRGSAVLREALYQIGFHAAQVCPPIGWAYLRARRRGLDQTRAVIHAANKANRLCFTLLREQRPYRPVSPAEKERFRRAREGSRSQGQKKQKRRRPRSKKR